MSATPGSAERWPRAALRALAASCWLLGPSGCAEPSPREESAAATIAQPLTVTEAVLEPPAAPAVGLAGPIAAAGSVALLGARTAVDIYEEEDLLIYERKGTTWHNTAFLPDPEPAVYGGLGGWGGYAVARDYAAAGADFAGDAHQGAVYVFRRGSGRWELDEILRRPEVGERGEFGSAVAFSGDRLLVTRSRPEPRDVYVFARAATGWILETMLPAPAPPSPAGAALSPDPIAADPGAAVVGGSGEDYRGAAYVFERQGSTWAEPVCVQPSDAPDGANFGSTLAIDGDVLVVGARRADYSTGAAYIFEREPTGWVERQKLTEPTPERHHDFGGFVGVSGGRIVVGATAGPVLDPKYFTCMYPCIPGTAYVYERGPSQWELVQTLRPSASAVNDQFPGSAALSGPSLLSLSYAGSFVFTFQSELGGSCASDEDCVSGRCAGGACAEPPEAGPPEDGGASDATADGAAPPDADPDAVAPDATDALVDSAEDDSPPGPTTDSGGGNGPGAARSTTGDPPGCGCRAARRSEPSGAVAWAVSLGAGIAERRRRRRARRARST